MVIDGWLWWYEMSLGRKANERVNEAIDAHTRTVMALPTTYM